MHASIRTRKIARIFQAATFLPSRMLIGQHVERGDHGIDLDTGKADAGAMILPVRER